jgi:hypothetical protein
MTYGRERVRKPGPDGKARSVVVRVAHGRMAGRAIGGLEERSGGAIWRTKTVIFPQRGSGIFESTPNSH